MPWILYLAISVCDLNWQYIQHLEYLNWTILLQNGAEAFSILFQRFFDQTSIFFITQGNTTL